MGKDSSQPLTGGIQAAQSSVDAANNSYNYGSEMYRQIRDTWQPYMQQIAQNDIASQGVQNALSANAAKGVIPLENSYFKGVMNYDTPQQEKLNAGAAEGAVSSNFEAGRDSAMSQLEGFGIDPSSTRYAALDIGSRAQQGAAEAAAGTSAIQTTKMQGLALKGQAAGLGTATATGAAGAGTGAGAGGSGALNAYAGAAAAPSAWMNAGANNMGVYTGAVNNFNYAQNQADQINNQSMSGFGQLAGGLLGMFEDGGPVGYDGGGPALGPGSTPGGQVPPQASPSQGVIPDDVDAKLTANEFVIPRDVAEWEGQKTFVAMIDKARKARQQFSQRTDIGGRAAPGQPSPTPAFVSRPQSSGVLPAALH